MLRDKNIVLAVSGSIAVYKAALLTRLFVKKGAKVRVVMSEAAQKFVSPLTFSNLSQQPVFTDIYSGTWSDHIKIANEADLFVLAPATYNTLSKMATGINQDAINAVFTASGCPVLVAPAMDGEMYNSAALQRNLQQLKADCDLRGFRQIGPDSGFLASGLEGLGRMAEPEDIVEAAESLMVEKLLEGKKVVVTAGPTREPIDPVRFISNRSTGKMGYEIARSATMHGAKVTLISGPSNEIAPLDVELVKVTTASEMYSATKEAFKDADLLIAAAAVADYTPANYAQEKIKKSEGQMNISLERTKDIIATMSAGKTPDQKMVGFAMETQNELANAKAKLQRKSLDMIVLNSLRDKGAGFGVDTNRVTIITAAEVTELPLMSKAEVSAQIIQHIHANFFAG